ncbi:protein tyrosine kinase domain-containing protein [Ditylenchus destructor]|uniref:non-specific protein-tyrosine kinase n=1 Tax=Ditylenchus destructor TaxID=166010 RepID=A0AAD4N6R4_9BILA|nr:protein tyrosine kinase domain-containing protein [Ditylenchus destructor]
MKLTDYSYANSSDPQTATSSNSVSSAPSLYTLLKSADLLAYYDQFKNVLKLRHAGDLAYCEEKDLTGIGMSRPEQKRLRHEYSKHFASQSSSLAGKLKKKMFRSGGDSTNNGYINSDPGSLSPTSYSTGDQAQHVIAAEHISLCKELGKGEFGSVFQAAWHLQNGSNGIMQVAVKRILPEKLISNATSFLQEAAIMTRMRHDHVVRLYGVVLDTKSVMLVSELAPCGSLLECLQKPAWPEPFAVYTLCDFALQIAQGMNYLSNQRLIHRDLAARNVLVSTPTKVKISDFGLSRSLGVGEDYYRSEFNPTMKLPIAWCAPECINFLRFTSASDIWAYGITLWEMFSYGKMPWNGKTGAEILHAIDVQHKKLDWPEACPSDFYRLMCECWSHHVEARPTFEDICQRLPEIMPQKLITITECHNNQWRELHFNKGELIVLLNKFPPSCNDGQMWFGAMSGAQLGLFRPEHTVAHLGAEIPSSSTALASSLISSNGTPNVSKKGAKCSPSSSSSQSNTAKKNCAKGAPRPLVGETDNERKKLLISQPQADLRHTCHVGIDGKTFGLMHVDKSELSRALPPMIHHSANPSAPSLSINVNNTAQQTFPSNPSSAIASAIASPAGISPHNVNRVFATSPSFNRSEISNNIPCLPPRLRTSDTTHNQTWRVSSPTSQHINTLQHSRLSRLGAENDTSPQPIPITSSSMAMKPPALPPKPSHSRKTDAPSSPTNNMLPKPAEYRAGVAAFPVEVQNSSPPESVLMSLRRESSKVDPCVDDASVLFARPVSLCATTVDELDLESTVGSFPSTTGDSLALSQVTENCGGETALDQVLCDLQKDITDFSLSTIGDFSDTRPLLDGDRRRYPEPKCRSKESPLDEAEKRQSVVRVMTPEETEKWRRRVMDEHRKAAKNLVRDIEAHHKLTGSLDIVEDNEETCTRAKSPGAAMRSSSLDQSCLPSLKQNSPSKTCGAFTSRLTSRCAPIDDPLWSEEAQAAYKLLVQCGSFLKDTSPSSLALLARLPNGKQCTEPSEKVENVDQPQKIEYLNSKLVGFEEITSEETSDRPNETRLPSPSKETRANGLTIHNKCAEITRMKAQYQNDNPNILEDSVEKDDRVPNQGKALPPAVPPKPKKRKGA